METIQLSETRQPPRKSIRSHYLSCINAFDELCTVLKASDCGAPEKQLLPTLVDEIGRFQVWARNAGAHRTGRVSMDHRLREASCIYEEVAVLLKELEDSLEEGRQSHINVYLSVPAK